MPTPKKKPSVDISQDLVIPPGLNQVLSTVKNFVSGELGLKAFINRIMYFHWDANHSDCELEVSTLLAAVLEAYGECAQDVEGVPLRERLRRLISPSAP